MCGLAAGEAGRGRWRGSVAWKRLAKFTLTRAPAGLACLGALYSQSRWARPPITMRAPLSGPRPLLLPAGRGLIRNRRDAPRLSTGTMHSGRLQVGQSPSGRCCRVTVEVDPQAVVRDLVIGGEDVGCFPQRGAGGVGEVGVLGGEPGLDDRRLAIQQSRCSQGRWRRAWRGVLRHAPGLASRDVLHPGGFVQLDPARLARIQFHASTVGVRWAAASASHGRH